MHCCQYLSHFREVLYRLNRSNRKMPYHQYLLNHLKMLYLLNLNSCQKHIPQSFLSCLELLLLLDLNSHKKHFCLWKLYRQADFHTKQYPRKQHFRYLLHCRELLFFLSYYFHKKLHRRYLLLFSVNRIRNNYFRCITHISLDFYGTVIKYYIHIIIVF